MSTACLRQLKPRGWPQFVKPVEPGQGAEAGPSAMRADRREAERSESRAKGRAGALSGRGLVGVASFWMLGRPLP